MASKIMKKKYICFTRVFKILFVPLACHTQAKRKYLLVYNTNILIPFHMEIKPTNF